METQKITTLSQMLDQMLNSDTLERLSIGHKALRFSNLSFRNLEGSAELGLKALKMLDFEDLETKKLGLDLLTCLPTEQGLTIILQLCQHSNPNIRRKAIMALCAIKSSSEVVIDALIAILKSNEIDDVKDFVPGYLGEFKNEKALVALLEVLPDNAGEEFLNTRCEIADSLKNFKDIRAEKALLSLTYDSDAEVRWYAIDALGFIKDPNSPLFSDLVNRLVEIVNDSQEGKHVRGNAIEVLGVFRFKSDEVISALQNVLEDHESYYYRELYGRAATLSKKAQEALRLITGTPK